jgi:hypothetical protein
VTYVLVPAGLALGQPKALYWSRSATLMASIAACVSA